MAPQKEWFEKDYYKILGVSESATEKEITQAYRKLAKELHPDVNKGSEEKFKEVTAAYDVLSNSQKRKEYDELRKLGPIGNPRGGSYSSTFRVDDLSDLFSDLLKGQGARFRWTTGRGTGPQRGDDIEADLTLSFKDAAYGGAVSVQVTKNVTCKTCKGTGADPKLRPETCKRCKGKGILENNQGLFSLAETCPECGGRGSVVKKRCPTCNGTGFEKENMPINVKIPAGVEDGQRIRIKGKGAPGKNNGPAGDLYVKVHVSPHRLFTRRHQDLQIKVPITFAEAALGTTIKVPTLDSGSVSIKIPPGTSSGRVFRVKGRGITVGSKTGDLLVTVEVDVPKNLTEKEKEAIEALKAASNASPREHLGV
jgi:molecular chaperone DnaJ